MFIFQRKFHILHQSLKEYCNPEITLRATKPNKSQVPFQIPTVRANFSDYETHSLRKQIYGYQRVKWEGGIN